MRMKIFLSHSNRQKPLVREIRRHFPEHIDTWIDEKQLLIGDDLEASFERQINENSDFVLLFLDDDAARSSWVKKEIFWALSAESNKKRTILLVVLIDPGALETLAINNLKNRRYIRIPDFSERSIEMVANNIVSDLFGMLCRDLDDIHNPKTSTKISFLEESDVFINNIAVNVMEIVFPYRQSNPIGINDLYNKLVERIEDDLLFQDFTKLIDVIFEKDLMPGISFDGHELFIMEEHYKWKANLSREKKIKVARVAAKQVRSGDTIAIDAGSATDEVVRILCNRLKNRALSNLKIVTNSLSAMTMLLDMSDLHGFDEHTCPFQAIIVGGFVRPNTRAIVKEQTDATGGFLIAQRSLGGADIGFVGVNGIYANASMTTHTNIEVENKKT